VEEEVPSSVVKLLDVIEDVSSVRLNEMVNDVIEDASLLRWNDVVHVWPYIYIQNMTSQLVYQLVYCHMLDYTPTQKTC
jgi:hypothetical protein